MAIHLSEVKHCFLLSEEEVINTDNCCGVECGHMGGFLMENITMLLLAVKSRVIIHY